MAKTGAEPLELTYPLRAVARLTGLSPALLRAWERRHGVIAPRRTPGGTRRYSAADLERLRLLKRAVDAGHRIGELAPLDAEELKRRAEIVAAPVLDAVLFALGRFDSAEAQRLLAIQLCALGPARFASDTALPLLREVGDRWADGRMSVAHEHLASSVLRSLLGSALQPSAHSLLGPRIVFATPPGERHELGLLTAALTALGAGANPLYLGAEVPIKDLLDAVNSAAAAALALSLVCLPHAQAARTVTALRGGLAVGARLWIGGAAARELEPARGVEQIESLAELEQRVALLRIMSANNG